MTTLNCSEILESHTRWPQLTGSIILHQCRKKKRGFFGKVKVAYVPLSLILIITLAGGTFWLHGHRKTLKKELESHQSEVERLTKHVSTLDEHINERTQTLQRHSEELEQARMQHKDLGGAIAEVRALVYGVYSL